VTRAWQRAQQKSRTRHRRDRESGAVVVETALIAPMLFFLIFVIIETGPLFLLWSSDKHAAQEGARMATVAGQTSTADYNILKAAEGPLRAVGNRLDYVIVFRAKDLYDKVPPECIAAGNSAIANNTPANTAVGYFKRVDGRFMTTDSDQTALAGMDWTRERPAIACNVYRFNQLGLPESRFQYDSTVVPLSLDRFWPATKRNDTIAVKQDYAGVYVQSRYTSMTGVITSRVVAHTYVGVIEALTVRS
jgi:TadE-like protein